MVDSEEEYRSSGNTLAAEWSDDKSIPSKEASYWKSLQELVIKSPRDKISANIRIPKNLWSVNAMKKHISRLFKRYDFDYNVSLKVWGGTLELHSNYLIWFLWGGHQ
jgi:hypothetical protein